MSLCDSFLLCERTLGARYSVPVSSLLFYSCVLNGNVVPATVFKVPRGIVFCHYPILVLANRVGFVSIGTGSFLVEATVFAVLRVTQHVAQAKRTRSL